MIKYANEVRPKKETKKSFRRNDASIIWEGDIALVHTVFKIFYLLQHWIEGGRGF